MPTAAKLVAALCFAVLGLLLAEIYKLGVPERSFWGYFSIICAGIGLLNGWFVMGSLAGRGLYASLGFGARTAITMVVWAVLIFSIYEMVYLSTKMRYGGPMEALLGAVRIAMNHSWSLMTVPMVGAILVGGVVAGAVTEFAASRWR